MFVLPRLAKKVLFQLNSKYRVGNSRRIYCSFLVSVKQNTPIFPNTCFASERYSLPMVSLETFQSGWFHEYFNQPRSVPRSSVYALSIKGSIMRSVQTDDSTKCKRFHYDPRNFHFKRKRNLQLPTIRAHFYPPFCFSHAEFHSSRSVPSSRPVITYRP